MTAIGQMQILPLGKWTSEQQDRWVYFINPVVTLHSNVIKSILIPTDLLDVITESTKSSSSLIAVGSRLRLQRYTYAIAVITNAWLTLYTNSLSRVVLFVKMRLLCYRISLFKRGNPAIVSIKRTSRLV
jgi:hypothetical protein